MMAYQVPTPRGGKSEKPSMVTTLAFCLFMAGLMAVSLWWGLTNLTPSEAERREEFRTHDSLERQRRMHATHRPVRQHRRSADLERLRVAFGPITLMGGGAFHLPVTCLTSYRI